MATIWLWLKTVVPKMHPGKWKQRLKPAQPKLLNFEPYPYDLRTSLGHFLLGHSRFGGSSGSLGIGWYLMDVASADGRGGARSENKSAAGVSRCDFSLKEAEG